MVSDNQGAYEKPKDDEKVVQMYWTLIEYEHGKIDFLTLLSRWESILDIKPGMQNEEALTTMVVL